MSERGGVSPESFGSQSGSRGLDDETRRFKGGFSNLLDQWEREKNLQKKADLERQVKGFAGKCRDVVSRDTVREVIRIIALESQVGVLGKEEVGVGILEGLLENEKTILDKVSEDISRYKRRYGRLPRGLKVDDLVDYVESEVRVAANRLKGGGGLCEIPNGMNLDVRVGDLLTEGKGSVNYGEILDKEVVVGEERMKVGDMSFAHTLNSLDRLATLRALKEAGQSFSQKELAMLEGEEHELKRASRVLYETAKYDLGMFDDDPLMPRPGENIGDKVERITNSAYWPRDWVHEARRLEGEFGPKGGMEEAKRNAYMYPYTELMRIDAWHYWDIFLKKVEGSAENEDEGRRLVEKYKKVFGGMVEYFKRRAVDEYEYAKLMALEEIGSASDEEKLRLLTLKHQLQLIQFGGYILHESTKQRGRWYVEAMYPGKGVNSEAGQEMGRKGSVVGREGDEDRREREWFALLQDLKGLTREDLKRFEKGDVDEIGAWMQLKLEGVVRGDQTAAEALESFAKWTGTRWDEIVLGAVAAIRGRGDLGQMSVKQLVELVKDKDVTNEKVVGMIEREGGTVGAALQEALRRREATRALDSLAENGVDSERLLVFAAKFEEAGRSTPTAEKLQSLTEESRKVFGGEGGRLRMVRIWERVKEPFKLFETREDLMKEYLNAKGEGDVARLAAAERKIKEAVGIEDGIELQMMLGWWRITGREGYWDARLSKTDPVIVYKRDDQGRMGWVAENYGGARATKWAEIFGRAVWARKLGLPFGEFTTNHRYDLACADFMLWMVGKKKGERKYWLNLEDPKEFVFAEDEWFLNCYEVWLAKEVGGGLATMEALKGWASGGNIEGLARVMGTYGHLSGKEYLRVMMLLWREAMWEELARGGSKGKSEQGGEGGGGTPEALIKRLKGSLGGVPVHKEIEKENLLKAAEEEAKAYITGWRKFRAGVIRWLKEGGIGSKGLVRASEDLFEKIWEFFLTIFSGRR